MMNDQVNAQRGRIANAALRKVEAQKQIEQAEFTIRQAEDEIIEARGIIAGLEFARQQEKTVEPADQAGTHDGP